MSYRDQLKEWISYAKRDFGHYISNDFPMQLFSASNVSDDTLSYIAKALYETVRTAQHSRYNSHAETKASEQKMFYLVPQVDSSGSVYYINRFTGGVAMSMVRQPNGLYSYHGPREMMTVFGGRNELGGMLDKISDNDFFHDHKHK